MTMATSASPSRYGLLRGGSESVDLSLLAARTAAALRRISAGLNIGPEDEATLTSMALLLTEAAGTVQFFGSGGREGAPPHGALAARVDATIDAVFDEPAQLADSHAVSERLTAMANRLSGADAPWSSQEADTLGAFFSELAQSVLNRTGHVGEIATAL